MNQFKFLGTITNILPLQSGTSQNGKDWQKLQFVVKEEKAEYPQSMVFTMMDAKKIENFTKYEKVGNAVEVAFNLSAREYNGKWYADVTAWSVFGAKSEDNIKQSAVITDMDLPF
jgi:hypothetical protein